jgi:hypothetical protein
MSCCWCGRATPQVCCHRCKLTHYAADPDNVPVYLPEFDDPPAPPEPARVIQLERLCAELHARGVEPIPFEPLPQEWIDLNEQRFFFELAGRDTEV